MSAWSDHDYRDDRAEALGEARTYYGHPEPCDDSFWLGVNVRADAIAQATEAALDAVDRVLALLPSFPPVGEDPQAAAPLPRTEAATCVQPSSPAPSKEAA